MLQLYFECFPSGQKGPLSLVSQYFERLWPKRCHCCGADWKPSTKTSNKPIIPQRSTGLDIFYLEQRSNISLGDLSAVSSKHINTTPCLLLEVHQIDSHFLLFIFPFLPSIFINIMPDGQNQYFPLCSEPTLLKISIQNRHWLATSGAPSAYLGCAFCFMGRMHCPCLPCPYSLLNSWGSKWAQTER